jgi:hypothetical protein
MKTPVERWPALPLQQWKDTAATLHRWTQIVGKTRLSLTPLVNHWWNSTLYVSARGLTTSTMHSGDVALEFEFDFVDHVLEIRSSGSKTVQLPLRARSVAAFYREYVDALNGIGVPLHINATPNEVEDATPFASDETHASYDPEFANRFWRILLESDRVFKIFRARFVGKSSPSHFFWGAMDLAVTRFSGRPAPRHPGGAPHCPDYVQTEGYSHELISAGFWPGTPGMLEQPSYYAYSYPEPAGFGDARVKPSAAYYDKEKLKEFFLPYDAVRAAPSPDDAILDFLQSTYEAGAKLMNWDRGSLERKSPGPLT